MYQTKARNAEFCGSAGWKTIYSTAPITPPIGWKLGPNTGKTNIDGTGWIPINFQNAPIGELINMNKLYIDPVNDPNKGLVYTFACNPTNGNFVLTAGLESQNYGDLTSKFNVTAKDNGIDPNRFEVGSNLELTPILNLTPPRPTSTLLTTTTPSINTSSSDKIKISDLLQIQNGLLLYYAKYNSYPKTKNPKQITLKSLLLETGITNKETSFDPTSGRAYLYGSDGSHYILSAILDDASNVALNSDEDGIKFGVDCDDPVYCVGM